jgi:nicotinamide-nucleotide amidase
MPEQANGDRMAGQLAEQIAERLGGRAVACAESCTAGRIAVAFASVEGASAWFRGGVVAYQTAVKRQLLDVAAPSVLSATAAAEMASGVAARLSAPVAVATTGVAGDEPEEGVPPGTVFLATLVDGDVRTLVCHFEGDADTVCDAGAAAALRALLDHLDSS